MKKNIVSIKDLEKQKREIEARLMEEYFTRIKTNYESLTIDQKATIFSSLEGFANYVPFNYEEAIRFRIESDLTQEQLAKLVGISQPRLSNYEIGKSNPYSVKDTQRYIEWLDSRKKAQIS